VAWIEELRAALGPERVRTDAGDLRAVSRDASPLHGAPACLAYPEEREHVERALQIAAEAGVAIVARGGGTSLAAGAIPPAGALVLAFNRMARVRELDAEERTALVEPGLTNFALDALARRHGLRYAPDPSSRRVSMIGGNIATNAGGLHCLAHGVTTDHVLGVEVVLTDGSVAWLDALDAPDMRALVVGSEGTLAVVTAALLSLLPVPEATGMVVCGFSRLEQAGEVAESIVRAGLPASALEYIDETMLGVISKMSPGVLPSGVEAATIEALVAEAGGSSRRAVGSAEQTRIWEARRTSGGAFGLLFPDSYTHDFAVPRDRIVEVLRGVSAITEAHRVEVVTVAHLGDGNIHPKIVYDGREAGAYERVIDASNAILELVLAHGGTLSGEHGIGLEKLGAMGRQFSPAELDMLRAVRASFDPEGILNPDKAVPLAGDEARRGVFAHA
jgi:glycolate oxidase subunit GlcD